MNTKVAAEQDRESKKCVRWSTVTVYEFDVAIGGSSIPRHGGPSVGLAKKPRCVWSTPLDVQNECAEDYEGKAVELPMHSPDDDDQEVAYQRQARKMDKVRERQQRRRRNRVRWLKPFERVTMLTKAGLSERRIYRMMKECAAICMSRRLSIRSP